MRAVSLLAGSAVVAVGLMFVLVNHQKTHAAELSTDDFVTTWKTDNTRSGSTNSTSIRIFATPVAGSSYDVDWDNDGVYNQLGVTGDVIHDFGVPGTYTVRIRGNLEHFHTGWEGLKLLSVDQWGTSQWKDLQSAFSNTNNLTIQATDTPDMSMLESMTLMFASAKGFNSDISHWDVSNVKTMNAMFSNADSFNQSLADWDVSSVTNMSSMFSEATAFNGNLAGWNTSNVTNMSSMFKGADSFNQSLVGWDVSNVTNMNYMFSEATAFNGSLAGWDVSKVPSMNYMFENATSFNGSLEGWNPSGAISMNRMFYGAAAFNQDLAGWNTSNVTDMTYMFYNATSFNGSLAGWDTSNLTSMAYMFYNATSFNGSLEGWDTSNVTNMSYMFANATAFNQDIGEWDVSNVTRMGRMFSSAAAFNQDLAGWNTSNVTDMTYMFYNAASFNGSLAGWDVTKLSDMTYMFNGADAFNGSLAGWDTSNVTNMSYMFANATAFNQDIGGWDTSNVTNMGGMFNYASAFNQDLDGWDTSNVTNMAYMLYYATAFDKSDSIAAFSMSSVTNISGILHNTALSSIQYDEIVRGWATQELPRGLSLSMPYCTSENERAYIAETFGWTVTGSQDCRTDFGAYGQTQVTIRSDKAVEGALLGALRTTDRLQDVTVSYELSCANPGTDDALFQLNGARNEELVIGSSLPYDAPLDQNKDNTYEVCVRSMVDDGHGFDTQLQVEVLPAPTPPQIADVSLDNDTKELRITGVGFLESDFGYILALEQSLVQLNGVDLKFCAAGFGMSAQDLVSAYSSIYPNVAQNVTDSRPCYMLISGGGMSVELTPTQALIWLPEDFDTTAQGTVSVNGSPTYTFNTVEGGGEENIPPTSHVDGTKPLDQNPTIPKTPTFSGVATPYSTVVVTVHSDPVTCTATADATGNWSCMLPASLPAGAHTVFVQVTNPDSSVVELGPYAVTVSDDGNGGAVDSNTPLAPNTGFLAQHAAILEKHQAAKATSTASIYAVIGSVAALLIGGIVYGSVRALQRNRS